MATYLVDERVVAEIGPACPFYVVVTRLNHQYSLSKVARPTAAELWAADKLKGKDTAQSNEMSRSLLAA